LDAGGHLTHGAKANLSGSLYSAQSYGLTERGEIDFHEVQTIANESRPRLIICGTTAYSRRIDFSRFRRIADEVGALLLADITHIAGLVATGLHESPIDVAHITTTCTFKQLFGPRGGLIMMGESHQLPMNGGGTLTDRMQRAVFPMLQGAPAINIIAAKARALQRAASPEFSALAERIVNNADCLAQALGKMGYKIVTGGTDNHIVLCELESRLTGKIAQAALEECGIIVNKNRVPRDQRTASITSGIRLGSNTVALRRMGPSEMVLCAELIDDVLRNVESMGDSEYLLSSSVRERIQKETASLCRKFPLLH
jgi:glycine hydroxymethyltransferase